MKLSTRFFVLLLTLSSFLASFLSPSAIASPASSTATTAILLTSFAPGGGPPSAAVTVRGSGFLTVTAVRFNGINASFSIVSDSVITAYVPGPASTGPIILSVEGASRVTRFVLDSPLPNPFVDETSVRLAAPPLTSVRVDIYDLLGRRIRILWSGPVGGGETTLRWDGRDASGRRAGAGLYFVRASDGKREEVRRIVLAR